MPQSKHYSTNENFPPRSIAKMIMQTIATAYTAKQQIQPLKLSTKIRKDGHVTSKKELAKWNHQLFQFSLMRKHRMLKYRCFNTGNTC